METFSIPSDTFTPEGITHGKAVPIKIAATLLPGLMFRSLEKSILLWRINIASIKTKFRLPVQSAIYGDIKLYYMTRTVININLHIFEYGLHTHTHVDLKQPNENQKKTLQYIKTWKIRKNSYMCEQFYIIAFTYKNIFHLQ